MKRYQCPSHTRPNCGGIRALFVQGQVREHLACAIGQRGAPFMLNAAPLILERRVLPRLARTLALGVPVGCHAFLSCASAAWPCKSFSFAQSPSLVVGPALAKGSSHFCSPLQLAPNVLVTLRSLGCGAQFLVAHISISFCSPFQLVPIVLVTLRSLSCGAEFLAWLLGSVGRLGRYAVLQCVPTT